MGDKQIPYGSKLKRAISKPLFDHKEEVLGHFCPFFDKKQVLMVAERVT